MSIIVLVYEKMNLDSLLWTFLEEYTPEKNWSMSLLSSLHKCSRSFYVEEPKAKGWNVVVSVTPRDLFYMGTWSISRWSRWVTWCSHVLVFQIILFRSSSMFWFHLFWTVSVYITWIGCTNFLSYTMLYFFLFIVYLFSSTLECITDVLEVADAPSTDCWAFFVPGPF